MKDSECVKVVCLCFHSVPGLSDLDLDVHVLDWQPQSWAAGPGASTFQHTVSPTKTKEERGWSRGCN